MAKTSDILSLIEADHRKVEDLFAEMDSTRATQKSQELFNQIYQELNLHALAEELVFYPAMQETKETKQYIEEAEEEHNAVKILLEEMKSLSPSDEEFKTKLHHLKDAVTHHVEEEESEIFDAVRNCMDEKTLQAMGKEFQTTKSQVDADIKTSLSRK